MEWVQDYLAKCPACAEYIDYCQGHGAIGDPYGHRILWAHDLGDHSECHPDGCDAAVHAMDPTNYL